MAPTEHPIPINLANDLVDLATYRQADRVKGGKPDPLIIHPIYSQDNEVYQEGRIVAVDDTTYREYKKTRPNDIVNKFGISYAEHVPLLLHRKLADVLIDTAIDMRDRYGQFTVAMDALRTYDAGLHMQQNRPDLVASGLLAKAGTSAHNRALAVDSKLFELHRGTPMPAGNIPLSMLMEADEKGHLDDLDMTTSNRFYQGEMSDAARQNRLNRLQAWQRASVKNKVPVANLLAEFWDDRVPGSPADMWRVLSSRALCIGADGNPKTNPAIQTLKTNLETLHEQQVQGLLTRQEFAESAHAMLAVTWNNFVFSSPQKQQLESILGPGGGEPPACTDFIFHEWLQTIHDQDLKNAGLAAQSPGSSDERYTAPPIGRVR